jgi:acyl-CoA hydrolase
MTRQISSLAEAFKAGERVFVPGYSGESALLGATLKADPQRAAGVHFVAVQFPGIDTIDYLGLHPEVRQTAFFMSPAVRRGMAEGRAELLAADYTGMAHYFGHGPELDVAVAQLSPPDADGWCSAGLNSDFLPLAWARARRRVAHINPLLPRTRGSFRVRLADVNQWIEAESPVLNYTDPAAGDIDLAIARHAASLIRDGDTLQCGIGTVPLALGQTLSNHRRLKLHAGMVTKTLQHLSEAGALDPDARVTTGVALGDAAFQDFVARHEALWFTDVTRTHDVAAIAATPRFIAVNSAAEVDLFGQVNSERVGGALQAGAGGLPAFAQGALASPGGRLIMCLRSSAARGTVSRIVPSLDHASLCTLPRYMADAVVTEHGVAQLRGLDIHQRAAALLAIAAPDHRDALAQAWEQQRAKL